ncbi:hypothetical protein DDB_G0279945 [Dictyostelium discoideum AX4]|uniref:DUF7906 domain-containing protein n=1 Tax=Dictyostelium discoideum TaxID=44689 RepID=Q54W34_DICDI|nr:hypothetical protein DDB_G0279945 [Dictyostelium discoideum AX4]EAL67444.1 hypothetical protein DDB_G0279945 [Dictyostelium discoideum AX4]|eukprot:XP_641416.1 hypothetical protein DDB_G0279945 [Dictyostelium discoideum AX4]
MKIKNVSKNLILYLFILHFLLVNIVHSNGLFDQLFKIQHTTNIDVRLIGFDSLEQDELKILLNKLNKDYSPTILYPKLQTIDLIKQNHKFNITEGSHNLNEEIKASVKKYISEFQHRSTLKQDEYLVPFDIVDNIIAQDYKQQNHISYVVYIINTIYDREDSIEKYTYSQLNSTTINTLHRDGINVVDHLCNVKLWQSKSESPNNPNNSNDGSGRYVWIDIGAETCTYGPQTKGTGLISNQQLPHTNSRFTKKLYDISTFFYHTIRQLISPPIYEIPEKYGWIDLEIQLIMIHDHLVGQLEVSEQFDWESIKEQLGEKMPLLPNQRITFSKREVSLLNNLYAAQIKQSSLKTHHSVLKGTQQFLDSKELHHWFKVHIQKFIPSYLDDSSKTIIPIFLFDISYKELLLLDRYYQAVSFPDMVIGIQTQSGLMKIDYQCDKQLGINPMDATKPILQSLLMTIWGVGSNSLVVNENSKQIENNFIWNIGYNPSNMFTNLKDLSFSQTDSAIRNYLYFDIISSIDSLKSIMDHIGDDETWEEFTHSIDNPSVRSIDSFFKSINSTITQINSNLQLHQYSKAYDRINQLSDLAMNISSVIHKIHSSKHSYLECEKSTFLLSEFISISFTTIIVIYFLYKVLRKSLF